MGRITISDTSEKVTNTYKSYAKRKDKFKIYSDNLKTYDVVYSHSGLYQKRFVDDKTSFPGAGVFRTTTYDYKVSKGETYYTTTGSYSPIDWNNVNNAAKSSYMMIISIFLRKMLKY